MKKTLFLLSATLLFSACSMQSEADIQKRINEAVAQKEKEIRAEIDLEKKDFLFEKNQECMSQTKKISEEREAYAKSNPASTDYSIVQDIFYSPVVNSCIYIWETESITGDSLKLLKKPFQGDNLEFCNFTLMNCDNFDEKIETYYKVF
jgi:hypothetical protein